MPVYLETDTLRLHDMQRPRGLALFPLSALLLGCVLDEVWEKLLRSERWGNARTLCMFQGILVQRRRLR